MNEAQFRSLFVDAIEGRLDDTARRQWDQLRLTDPTFAAFYDKMVLEHQRTSSRLAGPTQTAQPRRVSSKMFWVLAPLVGAVAALAGGLGMDSWVRNQRRQALDAASIQLAPLSPPAANAGPGNTPASNTPSDNAPPANQKPPVNQQPEPEPEPEPEPQPALEPWFRVAATSDGEARVLRPGATDYVEAAPGAGLWGGHMRVNRGSAVLVGEDCRMTLSGRGELELVGPRNVRLLRGRLSLRVLDPGWVLHCDGAELRLAAGDYVCNSLRGLSELAVLAGRVEADRDPDRASVGRNTLLELSRGLRESALVGEALRTLREEAALGVERKLFWHFEDGPRDCNQGVLVARGLDGGSALELDPSTPGVGTTHYEPLFKAEKGLRLRAWVHTGAASIEIMARVHLPEGIRQVGMKVALPPGEGWRLVDVALESLLAGPRREESGWIEGANYSGLQIGVPPQPDERLKGYALVIDDVEVYTLR